MANSIHRREFMQRAAALIPVMHIGGFSFAQVAAGSSEDQAQPSQQSKPAPRFARLRLRSSEIDSMAEFYRKSIGLPVTKNEDGTISIACGETVIEFAKAEEGQHPFYHFAFNIPHNKLDAAIKWMEPRSPLVKQGNGEVKFHFEAWDADAIYFSDPSGNIVEFIARHTLKNDKPGDFGVEDILCASEIGVVTPDVSATSARLKEALTLKTYKSAGEEFAAIGDEQGLFIVVKTGRRWLASNKNAEVHEGQVELNSAKPASQAALELSDAKFRVSCTVADQAR